MEKAQRRGHLAAPFPSLDGQVAPQLFAVCGRLHVKSRVQIPLLAAKDTPLTEDL